MLREEFDNKCAELWKDAFFEKFRSGTPSQEAMYTADDILEEFEDRFKNRVVD